MIRNVVFDLGNVLISFLPSDYLLKKNYPSTIRNTIMRDIFWSDEWKMLDNGDITVKEATEAIAARSTLKREEIALVFSFRTEIMFPLDDNVRLLPELQKRGYKLFFLSNFHLDTYELIKNDYYFFRYFDGGVISSEVKLSKPDPGIYRLLLDKYSLKADECLFIDDTGENVIGAEKSGMIGLFTGGSLKIVTELERKLDINLV